MFCELCQREVGTTKKFNWIIFIIGLLLFGVGGIAYLIYYFMFAPKICNICGSKKLKKVKKEKTAST